MGGVLNNVMLVFTKKNYITLCNITNRMYLHMLHYKIFRIASQINNKTDLLNKCIFYCMHYMSNINSEMKSISNYYHSHLHKCSK